MSDIVIRGMEMPESCYGCKISHGDNDYGDYSFCPLILKGMHSKNGKHKDCPLVSVAEITLGTSYDYLKAFVDNKRTYIEERS